jgi:hypothetical protein
VRVVRVINIKIIVAFCWGLNLFVDGLFFFVVGSIIIISDEINAITPPSFDGIDRRIA